MVIRLFRLAGVDRAVAAAVLGRVWQSLAGIVTLFFILRNFSPALQGYFQTFLSLIALQAFVDLGLLGLIVIVISHEWAGLEMLCDGRPSGDQEKLRRLASAVRFFSSWFAVASLVLLVVGGSAGWLILNQHGHSELWWRPWLVAIGLASSLMFCQSLVGVLEGANMVFQVALYRFVQAVLASLALWSSAAAGLGLWSLCAQLAMSLGCALIFLLVIYRRFFAGLFRVPKRSSFNWRADVWPMQWQLALQGVAGYFSASLLVPVMFTYHGPVEAGQMGLSLQVVQAMGGLATSWLTVAMPRLGTAFAKGDYARFDRQWLQSSSSSLGMLTIAAIAVIVIAVFAKEHQVPAAGRFLAPLPFAALAAWIIILHVIQCCAVYWRAQRVELLGFWGILPGTVTGLLVWFLGREFGATGAAAGAAAAALLVAAPLCISLFLKSRRAVERIRQERTL